MSLVASASSSIPDSYFSSALSRIGNFYVDYVLPLTLIGLVYTIVLFVKEMQKHQDAAFYGRFPYHSGNPFETPPTRGRSRRRSDS